MFIALVIQHAKRTRRILLSSVTDHKMCFVSIQIFSETFLVLRIIQRDIVINVRTYSSKVTSYSCMILIKLEYFSKYFRKNT